MSRLCWYIHPIIIRIAVFGIHPIIMRAADNKKVQEMSKINFKNKNILNEKIVLDFLST